MDANKTYQIWTGDNDTDGGMIVEKSEIENVVSLDNITVYGIEGIKISDTELNTKMSEYKKEINDGDDLCEFLETVGFNAVYSSYNGNVQMLNDVEEIRDLITYDATNKAFGNLNDCETLMSYQYWDGSNHKRIWAETYSISEDITIVPDSRICLDEWDGRNMVTGGVGEHQYIYKIATIDSEEVNDKYLLVFSSQWQGVQDTAKIVDKDDIEAHLKEIDRNVEEYIEILK